MPAEIRIDLDRLNEFIEMTESGQYQHKLLHYLLKSMRNMGARCRDPPIIVLTVDAIKLPNPIYTKGNIKITESAVNCG